MSYFDAFRADPPQFDLFAVMRRIERSLEKMGADQPRIGDSALPVHEKFRLGGRLVGFSFGQPPFMAFPASTISAVSLDEAGRLRVATQFLGFLGPQGALPFAVTEEAFYNAREHDPAFPRFLDLFGNRFQQLFFRAWADARPAAQHDRPSQDRFSAYVGSAVGLGSAPFGGLDTVPDLDKLAFAGLFAPQAKSASRLRGAVMGLFAVRASIEQFVGSWLPLEVPDSTRLGARNAALGEDTLLGASVFSIGDKFRIVLLVDDMEAYRAFLPEGAGQPAGRFSPPLVDLVFFYVGDELDWEVELAIPAAKAPPTCLGRSGQLGWTSWMPFEEGRGPALRRDAHFRPAERARSARARRAAAAAPVPASAPSRTEGSPSVRDGSVHRL